MKKITVMILLIISCVTLSGCNEVKYQKIYKLNNEVVSIDAESIGIGVDERKIKNEVESNMEVNTETEVEEVERKVGTVYIGDSRFVGMNQCCNISDTENTYVIAEIGQGYKWMINSALPELESIKASNKDIEEWNIILGLGINDLYNIDKYVSTYQELSINNKLSIVSINPIEEHLTITNEQIAECNNKLRDICDAKFIDTYTYLIDSGFETTDGLHYTKDTYTKIYGFIA